MRVRSAGAQIMAGLGCMLLLSSLDAKMQVASGAYECWAFNTARMDLNFEVTGPGEYVASDGSTGTFELDAATQAIRFTGYLAEVMPDGFTSIYHEPKGIPTVSFRGRGGAEVSFCEHPMTH